MVWGLQAVAWRLPADRVIAVGGKAVDALTTALGQTADVEECWVVKLVIEGLDWPGMRQREQPETFASVCGCVALHPAVLPKPRTPPAQKLVDLLKHPFCVKEARRAVLDALEFTYDRQFADLWEFVAFAEKEHPELDLLTPPKRPQR